MDKKRLKEYIIQLQLQLSLPFQFQGGKSIQGWGKKSKLTQYKRVPRDAVELQKKEEIKSFMNLRQYKKADAALKLEIFRQNKQKWMAWNKSKEKESKLQPRQIRNQKNYLDQLIWYCVLKDKDLVNESIISQ
ncbi:hypothetical protein TTHERM_00046880 (macronuclear) [Tetrahymena thermophila SB210]|uniref:Uncharacterized protein n=1 Tax=Tetrahymena thermophila (strain SB210) TaxID=312017 RepID=Q23DK3_TETTS|nr:hypothetical protein TTHERM_00046880 [Tetrahymena thermophila SB210]EAR94364.2 hypothetical protein TTHERM_00046880 [Tetrahymena thermophila SB210]|eukprot:XP_001014683.2 hypothetical protein TTHERM_00046880 [Tetrahymena thermophila SB210]